MGTRNISEKDVKKLYAKSGNRCAFPGCTCILYPDDTNNGIGNICHIEGVQPRSARYNTLLSDEELNDYNNLILLCENHHKTVDKNIEKYSPECLKEMKRNHEETIEKSLQKGSSVDFYKSLNKIFNKYDFDRIVGGEIFLLGYCLLDFNNVDNGLSEIEALLNHDSALNITNEERINIKNLIGMIDDISYKASTLATGGSIPSQITTPKFTDPEEYEKMSALSGRAVEIYNKFRYGIE